MWYLIWIVIAFLAGSLPFSVWIGQRMLKQDIRQYGDANPGATNVLRAGGRGSYVVALLLDLLKGALPVGLAHFTFHFTGWALIGVALAPLLGHAFSPFLRGRGGKAVATTGGIWAGLTLWEGPTVSGLLLGLSTLILPANGWSVITSMLGLLLYLLATPASWNLLDARPDRWVIITIWLGNFLLLLWKHRADFRIERG